MLLTAAVCGWLLAAPPAAPVIATGVPAATRDKPQSKLWFAHGRWWAWLPAKAGSGVWERTAGGWRRLAHLDAALAPLPGQADVWADADTARAVLVGSDAVATVALKYDPAAGTYRPAGRPTVWPTEKSEVNVETATIARDGTGRWWVAYTRDRAVWVRTSADADTWAGPHRIGGPLADDDICCGVALPGAVGVLWSDQKTDAVWFRRHPDGNGPTDWPAAEAVERGNGTADDHLSAAVAADGTLFVATKNSVDAIDRPQLVLRVRSPAGGWTNTPYAPRTAAGEPSRPIAVAGPGAVVLAHTVYRRGRGDAPDPIVFLACAPAAADPTRPFAALLTAAEGVNDVTGPKAGFPSAAGAPWLVLASDRTGNVYEAAVPRPPGR